MNSSTLNQDSNLVESLLETNKASTPLNANSIIEKQGSASIIVES